MKLIDMHCDTIWKLMDLDKKGDLMDNLCAVSIPGMKKAGTAVQLFACFAYVQGMSGEYDEGYRHVLEMLRFMDAEIKKYPDDVAHAYSYEDIRENERKKKVSAVLTVEEGGILNGEMERLDVLQKEGIRLVTILWNDENCFGFPNSREKRIMEKGLKPFGAEAVKRIGELKMITDVSHSSDGVFYDVLDCAEGPVVASHSNCRELCPHPRNLSDSMIRKLAEKGGTAGLNFYGAFLGTQDASRVEEMAAHVLHMIKCGGEEFPMIGSDFDGFDGIRHMDIPRTENIDRLWEALKKKGVSETVLDKIWYGNALRILKEI